MFTHSESRGGAGRVGGGRTPAWKPGLLSSFTFLMAGHGRSVSAAMMLGDPGYAQVQLAIARSLDDKPLRQVAREMEEAVLCGVVQWPATSSSPTHRLSIPFRT